MSEDVKVYAFKDIIFKRQNIPGVRLKVLMPDKELKQYVGLNREELVDKINYWRNLEQK